ncbi:hypothetical protein CVT24_002027 [Panaeolus cyanescens]|uniref:Uncharacterized protein n=1 Tax=Panaeolus cyanescens TaxID=181874 RepID=A0A409YHJ7_9AGAR|nr:hypothetical protein CVT24_002027 [Panaeolus cyanescens]
MSGNNRGGLTGGRGRGGSFNVGGGGRGGGQQPGSLRNQNSRNNLGNKDFHHNRRGGSFNSGGNPPGGPSNASGSGNYPHQNSSFRGRNQNHPGPNRNRNDGGSGTSFGARDAASSNLGKKDENRRTLTDFKIVGLSIPDLHWTWGSIPPSKAIKVEDAASVNGTDGNKLEANAEEKTEAVKVEQDDAKGLQESPVATKVASEGSLPPSRIRIYFHTPVTADDARPIPHNPGYGDGPSDSRKGKRKKLEDDDGDVEERRAPPPPPQMGVLNHDDRSSVPASVAPSVAETASEGDWLMAAIVEGEDDAVTAGQSHPVDEDEDQLHISPVDAQDGHDMATDHEVIDDQGNHEGVVAAGDTNMHSTEVDGHENDTIQVDKGAAATEEVADRADVEHQLTTESHDSSISAHEPSREDASSFSISASVFDITSPDLVSSHQSSLLHSADPSADHHESIETQGSPELQRVAKSLQAASVESTFIDIDNQQETQVDDSDYNATQIIEDVKEIEPSTSATTGDAPSTTNAQVESKPTTPSANRLSISYAHGNRRLVVNAEVVDSLKLFRSEGRIEVLINANREGTDALKGIIMEGLSESTKSYLPLPPSEEPDATIPNFKQVTPPSVLKLVVYLDMERPLSEPKWAKSGDVQEWLKSMFGRMFWVAGDAAEGWEKKIHVVDPDPPPTIWTVLDAWATNSPVGALTERQRFLKTHLTEIDNILEILLRLVRGERATPFSQSAPTISAPSISGPLLSALSPASAHGAQQTHVSLAVLAIFRMTTEYAVQALGDKGKVEVEERIGEIVRCLPSHLIYKSLDGIFKEWRVEKKGR